MNMMPGFIAPLPPSALPQCSPRLVAIARNPQRAHRDVHDRTDAVAAVYGRISRLLERAFRAAVERAARPDEALTAAVAGRYDLILVNRILDDDGSSDIELIRSRRGEPAGAAVPVMLVSNVPDAQRAAISFGALPGFGKSELNDPALIPRLSQVLRTTRRA